MRLPCALQKLTIRAGHSKISARRRLFTLNEVKGPQSLGDLLGRPALHHPAARKPGAAARKLPLPSSEQALDPVIF